MPTRARRRLRHVVVNPGGGHDLHRQPFDFSSGYEERRRELVEPFINDISMDKIPADHPGRPTEDDTDAIMNALNAIIALRHIIQVGSSKKQACPFEPRDLWPRFFAWMKCLHRNCIIRHGYDETTQETAIIEIACLAHTYTYEATLVGVVINTPGFMTFITELWFKEQQYLAKYPKLKAGYRGLVFSETMAQLIQVTEADKRKDRVTEMIEAAGGSMETLANYIMKYLRSALSAGILNFHLISMVLYILTMCCIENERLLGIFMRRSAAFFVAKALLAAAKQAKKPYALDILHTIRSSYLFFGIIPLFGKGPYWMIQSLESGLLQGLLLSCAIAKTELPAPNEDVAVQTLERIAKSLVLHSVLRALKRPFQEILESDFAQPGPAGHLWEHWLAFKEVALERLVILGISDTFGLAKANKSCDYAACLNNSDNDEINALRCAGCYNAHYCTRECQRKAWPQHRTFCQSVQERLEEEAVPPHEVYPEVMFFMFLVDQTFNLHRDIVLDRIFDFCDKNKEKITSFDQLSNYVVGLDFQSFPMVITAGKSLEFKTKCMLREKDEFPVEIPSFRPITNVLQELVGSHVDEDGPKIIVQTQAPMIGAWFPDVRNFFVTMHCEFRERFNQKWRARYYGQNVG